MHVPFFLPTSRGSLAAVAHLPEGEPRAEAAVLMLTGGRAGRAVLRSVAEGLATEGFVCLRFDYPGTGATPVTGSLAREELVDLSLEVARWWRERTGAEHLAVVGRCLGARLGVSIAAREEAVTRVAGIYLPMARAGIARRIRQGVRTLDARGPRLASRLLQGPRVLDRTEARGPVAGSLETDLAAARCRFRFLYGAEDQAYDAFREVLSRAPDALQQRVEVALFPGARLHGIRDVAHDPWICSQISEALRT